MLVVVLLLVVLAAGVLVGAVGAGEPEWGWIAVLLSVLGAALLLTERRRRRASRSSAPDAESTADSPAASTSAAGTSTARTSTARTPMAGTAAQPVVGPEPAESDPLPARTAGGTGALGRRSAESGGTAVLGPVQDRATGADDIASSAATKRWERPPAPDPDARVLVVDEHPRYHLPECPWLRDRETIRLVFREAQELGFTPCARCAPYATLAGRAASS